MPFSSILQTPIGYLKIEGTKTHIIKIAFSKELNNNPNELTEKAKPQLNEYFMGNRRIFDFPFLFQGTKFQEKVWRLLMKIPFGQTLSYSALSKLYGDKKAIRAVAAANGKNQLAILAPCHRIIGKDGSLTGYAWGLDKKKWLLQHEGAFPKELF